MNQIYQVYELTAVMSMMYEVGPEMTDGSSHTIFNPVGEGNTDMALGGASGSKTKDREGKKNKGFAICKWQPKGKWCSSKAQET